MILFFDVETTGLPTRRNAHYSDLAVWPRIVSVSWALFRGPDSKAVHRHAIIRPNGYIIPEESTRIHGITTDRAIREGPPIQAVLASLLQDVGIQRPQLAVAHNMNFDRPILLAEFLRAGFEVSFANLPT
jgi:DNA polymerase III epsilon subunit-like protein